MNLRIIFILLLALPGFAANSITSVVVYPGWAEVTRTIDASATSAQVTLPAWVDLGSIQARGAGVLATHKRLQTMPPLSKKEVKARSEAIEAIRKELAEAEAQHALLVASTKTQRDYFAKLMEWKLGAPPQEMTSRRFTDAEFAEFVKFRDVLAELDNKEHQSQLAISAIQERIAEAEQTLKEDQSKPAKEQTIVDVDLAPGTESFTLEYRLPGATWHPTTEVTPVGDSLRLTRRALIRQMTGEDWKDVSLTLRSSDLGDPSALYAKIAASIEPDENGENPFRQDFARYDAANGTAQEIAEFASLLGERREHKLADSASILSGAAAVRLDLATSTVPMTRVYSLNAQKRDSAWLTGEITPDATQMLGPLNVNVAPGRRDRHQRDPPALPRIQRPQHRRRKRLPGFELSPHRTEQPCELRKHRP
jgi:DNA replication initiation complex subunit (GINS family)